LVLSKISLHSFRLLQFHHGKAITSVGVITFQLLFFQPWT
jgi:hypothetical protein